MTPAAIAALGLGQCVNWGVLYYSYGVLMGPMERDLGLPRWAAAGAFSLALLVSALMAPSVGRAVDRGGGPRLMRAGGYAAAAILTVWALVPSVLTSYLAWTMLGVCMAATLYEPAFAIAGRAAVSSADRLRSLSGITVLGGLASTVFLPLTAVLVTTWGWQGATAALGSIIAVSTFFCTRFTTTSRPVATVGLRSTARSTESAPPAFRLIVLFSIASFTSAGFAATAVSAFVERGFTPARAAMIAALMGVMQLPGRAVFMFDRLPNSPSFLLTASLALQAGGLLALSVVTPALVAAGVAMFAIGNGMMTLARPHLVQEVFGVAHAGHANGRIARAQHIARAGGPIAVAWLAGIAGYQAVFGALAIVIVAAATVFRPTILANESVHLQEVT